MEYRRLGRTALRVSPICLGTMNFGPLTTEPDSYTIMDRALEHGINFFDTANRYGGPKGPGTTEEIIGRWLAQGGGRREKVVLATKVFGPMTRVAERRRSLGAPHPRTRATRASAACRPITSTCTRCTTSTAAATWDEIWQAMETLVQQGKVVYVGSSNFAGWNIAQANEAAKSRNFLGLVSEQSLYNLASRTVELEVLPACRFYGLGVIPWSPLAGGMLGGSGTGDTARRKSVQPRYERIRPQLERWEKLCAELGEEPAAVALAWLLHQPGVTAPIIGPRTLEQLKARRCAPLEVEARRRDARDARRDLSRSGRTRARGLRLVAHEQRSRARMDVYEALYTTRAMRRCKPDPIPLDVQQRILDAAIRAPSGGNTQNWRFMLVDDPTSRPSSGRSTGTVSRSCG